jgi:hypothetical protein
MSGPHVSGRQAITACRRSPFHRKREPFTEAKLVASIEEVAGKGVEVGAQKSRTQSTEGE